ncbi:MAG TPA: hypothetical protein VLB44_15165 [Kofleriaceae bacterium]|nr:hypothetical protein [Kofleriaceae bacterium]
MSRQSRIKRLYSRRLAKKLAAATAANRTALEALAEYESRHEIARQRDKGWKLVTKLETGEGVFVRDDDVVGLHIQLPSALYKRLDTEATQRETTKRQMVIAALERYLDEST